MKTTLKLSLYLFLRVLMICLLCFMCVPLSAREGFGWLTPVLAVFYLIVLLYFMIFTSWTVGCKDKIRVDAGKAARAPGRGFFAAAIVFVPLEALFLAAFLLREGLAGQILNIANLALSFFGYYTLTAFTGRAGSLPDANGVIVYTVLAAVCIVACGAAYIIGLKNIKIIQPWLNKWKG